MRPWQSDGFARDHTANTAPRLPSLLARPRRLELSLAYFVNQLDSFSVTSPLSETLDPSLGWIRCFTPAGDELGGATTGYPLFKPWCQTSLLRYGCPSERPTRVIRPLRGNDTPSNRESAASMSSRLYPNASVQCGTHTSGW